MASSQSYELLENGELAGDGDELALEELEEVTLAPNVKREFLESTQTTKRWPESGWRSLEDVRERWSTRLRPFCNLWTTCIILGVMLIVVLLLLVIKGFAGSYPQEDVLQYIDPLIGTGPGGHVFAGPTLPFGMAKPVADVRGEHMGGFASDRTPILGFSHLHDSGTGGSPSMGNLPIFLHPECSNINACRFSKGLRDTNYIPESVASRVGYFSIELVSGLRAEMAASERAALYRFSFTNATDLNPVILADGSDLPGSNGPRSLWKLEGVNWDDAYAAIVKDAEEQPKNWDVEGRGALDSWKNLGYIPYRDSTPGGLRTRSVSRTYEYAYNDFCIAEMANATNRREDYAKYTQRAGNWKNLIDWDLESMGFKGFPQPRLANSTFVFQNATLCSDLNNFDGCYLNPSGHETYEGSPWLYLFYVPHDMAGLVASLGGREAYLSRLHTLHNSGVLYMGDEQAFLTAFLYHYGGRPGLSAKETHRYIPSMFNDTIEGIPGNDDSGATGTFVFFSMLGIFPNAGQSVYFIIPPFFPSVSIKSSQTGKTATIRNVNFDPSYEKVYIQSARLNGRDYRKNWIDHSFFLEGGMLEFVLGTEESEWGTRDEDLPPSKSTGLFLGL
ncbi:glycoside hydrolase family 92 protein [Dothistroma septosporum NZE10]|uniref:Glycoside hydrolase family 92 protein n=1 Tax=Dothistroma septosporum (strain NZE10 / CBS 128990) TaxID=675120 RepID=N1PZ84_DOTSN|nr:glycoside hydrolase family 92 protein [Dothistroma septosporum NZE10]